MFKPLSAALLAAPLLFTSSAPVEAHIQPNWFSQENPGSYRHAKVNGSKDTVYDTHQVCWFDKETRELYGHCTERTYIYNCRTKLITFVGWEGDESMLGIKFARGERGDAACRAHFNFD